MGGQIITITHYIATFQHNSEFLKSNFSQIIANVINNGEKWVAKLDVGADESNKMKFSQIVAKITIMINNVGGKNK